MITTVASVVSLYWDLVTFNNDLKIKQQTLDLDTKLYEDNKRRADLGAIAPIDIIQAEADMKAAAAGCDRAANRRSCSRR